MFAKHAASSVRFFMAPACALILLCALTGCSSKVTYLDNRDVKIKVSAVEEKDYILLYLNFENRSLSSVNSSVYRVEWVDGDGRVLETTDWRPLILKGATPVRVTERNTLPGAVDYNIQISNDAR